MTPVPVYRIRVQGRLAPGWSDWFDNMTVTLEPNGDTTLAGPVVDQPALHGLLVKVRDLGLTLISVARVEEGNSPQDGVV